MWWPSGPAKPYPRSRPQRRAPDPRKTLTMLKWASRAAAQTGEVKPQDRKDGRDGLKAALVRPPLVAAVDLGASKVTCFIMKPEGVRKADRTLTTAGVGY